MKINKRISQINIIVNCREYQEAKAREKERQRKRKEGTTGDMYLNNYQEGNSGLK